MISLRKLFRLLRNAEISFCAYDGTPYTLINSALDCYVKEGRHSIATFETMSFRNRGSVLHIDHFAVTTSMRGRGKGAAILRGFAQLVMEQRPCVDRITFDLGRARDGSYIEKLAEARSELLKAIGAHDIREGRPNSRRICVSVVWGRDRWNEG